MRPAVGTKQQPRPLVGECWHSGTTDSRGLGCPEARRPIVGVRSLLAVAVGRSLPAVVVERSCMASVVGKIGDESVESIGTEVVIAVAAAADAAVVAVK